MKKNAKTLAIAMLLLVTMIWGSGFIATDYAIASGLPTAWIMMIRFLVGALMIGIPFAKHLRQSSRGTILRGMGAGAILFAAFYSQTVGQGQTNVSNAAFLTATNVVMIPFLMWLITRKRPALTVFGLCLMTMAGVVLLTMQEGFRPTLGRGDAIVLLCAFLFALHITYLDVCTSGEDPVRIAFWQLLSAGLLGVCAVLLGRVPAAPEQLRAGIGPVLYLGVFSTGVCYFLQTWAQTRVNASEAGIVLSAEGFFGTLFSLLLGLERFRWTIVLGGLLITLSVILSETMAGEKNPEKASEKN